MLFMLMHSDVVYDTTVIFLTAIFIEMGLFSLPLGSFSLSLEYAIQYTVMKATE